MSRQTFPIQAPTGTSELLISEVNDAWGMMGAGGPEFRAVYGRYIFRDTVAGGSRLRSRNGMYKLLQAAAVNTRYVGDTEERSVSQVGGKILIGPAIAERVEPDGVPFDAVSPTADPDGEIEDIVRKAFARWANQLPRREVLGLVVNNKKSSGHNALTGDSYVYTKGTTFFSTTHRINPFYAAAATLPGTNRTNTFANTHTLSGHISEANWATIKNTIRQIPDLDGVELPYADGFGAPLVTVGTEMQWLRWARVFGGDAGIARAQMVVESAHRTGAMLPAMYFGGIQLYCDPYLYTAAEDTAAAEKTAYLWLDGGRLPIIEREEVTPFVSMEYMLGKNNSWMLYIQAKRDVIWGEPRALHRIIEGDEV